MRAATAEVFQPALLLWSRPLLEELARRFAQQRREPARWLLRLRLERVASGYDRPFAPKGDEKDVAQIVVGLPRHDGF